MTAIRLSSDEPTVYVVDDDDAVRDAILLRLKVEGFRAQGFGSANAFLAEVGPDSTGCLVLDIRMPGKSGLELQAELVERSARIPIVIITGHGDVPAARAAFRAGAVDFLEKPLDVVALLGAVRTALEQDRRHREDIAAERALESRLACLTAREREVLELVYDGHQNREIAAALDLSVRTVEVHKSHLMEKLGVGSLSELVRLLRGTRTRR